MVFNSLISIVTNPEFPFSALGSVHARSKITRFRLLKVPIIVTQKVSLGEIRPHRRGSEVDFVTEIYETGKIVLKSIQTFVFFHPSKDEGVKPAPSPEINEN
jgi:hypothetical protein